MSSAERASEPDACGALGCRNTTDLQEIDNGRVARTLCPSCAQEFKQRRT